MSWQPPKVTPLGHDAANQEINLVTYEDADRRQVSRVDVGGAAFIAFDHIEDGLEDLMRASLAPPISLKVGDVVSMTDFSGHEWTGGVVTALRAAEIYVRWPDGVIGTFQRRHAQYLHRAA
uniref:hypothetical protein n=1 Tax=Pseudonocardia sp. CA-138482 TaxID=3240023 RepID=UPI003F499AC7